MPIFLLEQDLEDLNEMSFAAVEADGNIKNAAWTSTP
jgi:hypothetical protein